MSHYQKPPELYDGLRLHQNENTGGCSPRVLDALARLRAGTDRLLSAVRRGDGGGRAAIWASTRIGITLVNGLDEGIMALAVAYLRPSPGGPRARSDRARAGIRDLSLRHRGRRRRARAGDAASRTSSFPLDEVLAAITPNTRVVFLTNPNNPDRRRHAARGDPHDRARGAVRRRRLRRRGLRGVRRRQLHSGAGRVPERDRRPDVFEGVRPGRPAHRLPGRRAGDASTRSARRSRSTASTSPRSSPCRRRSTDLDYLNDYLRQVAESKALLYAACDRLGLTYGRAQSNFVLVRAGDRTDARRQGRARARHLPARSLDRTWLRRLHAHRHRHRRTHAASASR